MSKIGQAVIEAQERTGKTVAEIELFDIAPEDLTDFYVGQAIWQLECNVNELNALGADLSPNKKELDRIIAKLTKMAEKAGKRG